MLKRRFLMFATADYINCGSMPTLIKAKNFLLRDVKQKEGFRFRIVDSITRKVVCSHKTIP